MKFLGPLKFLGSPEIWGYLLTLFPNLPTATQIFGLQIFFLRENIFDYLKVGTDISVQG